MTERAGAAAPTADEAAAIARWQQAAAIVDELLALDPAARAAALARVAGSDAALAHDVARWLAAAEAPDAVLDGAPLPSAGLPGLGAPLPTPPPSLAPDTTIGPWRIVRLLGRGGMGDVYEAARDDGTFERRVALKVVRDVPGRDLLVARFARERALLARLDHPGIARLLDAGLLADGTPFYAMELVDGQPIDAWCDARRATVADRVRLVRQACEAVASAHARLVVHRDLKPSNILVTPEGTVKVVDFGLATVVDELAADEPADPGRRLDTPLAHQTLRAFTPAFASPEQIRGEPATVAVDVYAIAAITYALLTGRAPHAHHGTLAETARAVLETDAAPASARAAQATPAQLAARRTSPAQLAATLRGDLDAILARGLARDPAQRYAGLDAVALEITRWLDGRPVLARPADWRYRADRFVRRHRTGVAAAALALGSLVVATGTALVQARQAERTATRATAMNAMLLELFELPYPFDSARSRQQSLRALLDSGRARVTAMTEPNDPGGSDVLLALARGYEGLGDFGAAVALARQAVDWRTRLLGPTAYPVGLAHAALAETLLRHGSWREAVVHYDTAMVALAARHGPRSIPVLVQRQARARALLNLGATEAAERELRAVVALWADSAGQRRGPYAHALHWLGHLSLGRRRYVAADSWYRAALTARERIGGNAVEIANTQGDLAMARLGLGDTAAAARLLTTSLATKVRELGPTDPEVIDDRVKLARLALVQGRPADAGRWLATARADYARAGPPPAYRLASLLEAQAATRLADGDADSAVTLAHQALAAMAPDVGPSAGRAELYALVARGEQARRRTREAAEARSRCARELAPSAPALVAVICDAR